MGEPRVFRQNSRKITNWKTFSHKREDLQQNSMLRRTIGNQPAKQTDCSLFCGQISALYSRNYTHRYPFFSRKENS